jgi:hypothetical protein
VFTKSLSIAAVIFATAAAGSAEDGPVVESAKSSRLRTAKPPRPAQSAPSATAHNRKYFRRLRVVLAKRSSLQRSSLQQTAGGFPHVG